MLYSAAMNRRQAIALLAVSAPALAQPVTQNNRFEGCWKLRSCVRTLRDGKTLYPFGRNPVGRLVYEKSGRMIAILMRPDRRSTVPPDIDLDQAPQEELREVVSGFLAYYGTYQLDHVNKTVTHHVEASLVPSWVGVKLKRHFQFDGSSLVLTRELPDGTKPDRLVWDRELA